MKKTFQVSAALMFLLGATQLTKAQNYKFGGGIFIDFGTGVTAVGPHVKYFFNNNFSMQPAILFVSGSTIGGVDFQYNGNIPGASGLSWNIGAGPQVWFGKGYSDFMLRPSLGLEYTIPEVPLNFGFDWRPSLTFDEGTYFTAARFGVSLKYIFKR